MPRRLVVCLDGTNNQPREGETNVQRLYRMTARLPDRQLSYYQPGIGTVTPLGVFSPLRSRLMQIWDSATGWMLERHVCSAYRYLMAVHRPGDQLFVFGFSRGAYCARVLCGMLSTVGLLHPGMEEMVPFAWNEYRSFRPGRPADVQRAAFKHAARFKKRYSRNVELTFLGLWDTVSSVGLPWSPRIFLRTASNRDVGVVRHAAALDEHRAMFTQNLWRGNPKHAQDVREVWFPGVHGDVGGGYPENEAGLSLVALGWMLREALAAGLVTDPGEQAAVLPIGDDIASLTAQYAGSRMHDSMSRFWRLAEYAPLPRWAQDANGTWARHWHPHKFHARVPPEGASIHRSVFVRRDLVSDYRPPNLPASTIAVD